MISKSTIKLIQSLKHKKYRQKYDLFIAEGRKTVETILSTGVHIPQHIFLTSHEASLFAKHGDAVQVVEEKELQQASLQQSGADVIAILKLPPMRELDMSTTKSMIYLDDVQDPGNVGTIIRVADWFGIDEVVRSEGSADFYNPKVVQSTMGSIAGVGLHTMDAESWCLLSDNYVIASALGGGDSLNLVTEGCISLVIGNEGKGASTQLLDRADVIYSIAGAKDRCAESLNASAAASILMDRIFGGITCR